MFPKEPRMSRFLRHFLAKNRFLCEKRLSKSCFKKRCPARLKQNPIPMPRGSQRSSLACALFRQETVVRATVEALFEILVQKQLFEQPLKLCLRFLCRNIELNWDSSLLKLYVSLVVVQRSVIWHALGQGPANFHATLIYKCVTKKVPIEAFYQVMFPKNSTRSGTRLLRQFVRLLYK